MLSALDDLPEHDPQINAQMEEIEESLRVTGQGRFRDVFKNGELRLLNRTCLACGGQMFQQMVCRGSQKAQERVDEVVVRHQCTRILCDHDLPHVSRSQQHACKDSRRLRLHLADNLFTDRRSYSRPCRTTKTHDYQCHWHGLLYGHRCWYLERQWQYSGGWSCWSFHLHVQPLLPDRVPWSHLLIWSVLMGEFCGWRHLLTFGLFAL